MIAAFAGCGRDGYLSGKYEGNRWVQDGEEVDSRRQVRRQHRMLERPIADVEGAR